MKQVYLFIMDSSNIDVDNVLNNPLFTSSDLEELKKYNNIEVKKEKIVSLLLKRKYIKNFYINEYGKPLSNDVCFNVSHSHGLVVLALASVDVGVDLELVKPQKIDIKKYVSSKEEYEYIKDDDFRFFEIWTSKESITKCKGTGVVDPIKDIISLPLNGIKEFKDELYYSHSFTLNDNYVCSITLKGEEDFFTIKRIENI